MWNWFLISFFYYDWLFANDYQAYLLALETIWGIGGTWFFISFISAILFIISWFTYHSYNKKYLPALKSLFNKMQTEWYIEKDLTKYPESLQMAFWEYYWFDWSQDSNHYLHHWVCWYGFLALKYFFYEYDQLVFPINQSDKWSGLCSSFLKLNTYNNRVIYNIFHNKNN